MTGTTFELHVGSSETRASAQERIDSRNPSSPGQISSAGPRTDAAPGGRLSTLDLLEAEAIHIIREVVAEFERPVALFYGGKDSVLVLHLAAKADRKSVV